MAQANRRGKNKARSAGAFLQSEDDLRGKQRAEAFRHVAILPCSAAESPEWSFSAARLIDCSDDGIGILSAIPFEVGDEFLVKMHYRKVMLARYCVVHVNQMKGGEMRLGAQFVGYLCGPDDNVTPSQILGPINNPRKRARTEADAN